MIGLYRPGSSLLHRAPAGLKLVVLAAAVVALLTVDDPRRLAVAAVVVAVLYAVARIPPRVAAAQLRPMLWFAAFLLVVQTVLTDWTTAVGLVARLVLVVSLAALVTLTTRVTAMLDVVEAGLQPLRHVGVRPRRVGLVLALTIRAVPVIARVVGTVRDAHRARGGSGPPWRLLVPVLVRVLRQADALSEALVARGLDDDADDEADDADDADQPVRGR